MKRALIIMAGIVLCLPPAHAEETEEAAAAITRTIEEFCLAATDEAAERRAANEAAALKDLEARVGQRIDLLDTRKQELAALIRRQEELRQLAVKEVVDIYAGMAPDIAAQQMEKVDVRLASSVLRQLKPRQASAILNEMTPELASRLVKLLASAAPRSEAKP